MPDMPNALAGDFQRLRMLDSKMAAAFCGFNEEYWRKLHREGKTPPAIRLTGRKLGWSLATLIEWQDEAVRRATEKAQEPIAA